MSFAFNWSAFTQEQLFLQRCKQLLEDALNKKKPQIIEDNIRIEELNWGGTPPTMEILEIGELANDRFRGIFKVTYNGSASLTLCTKVQANLLNVYAATTPSFVMPKFIGAQCSFSIPVNLSLSDFRLSAIVIVVFSKAKGLTVVLRNDPLQQVKVSSTFDSVPGIASFLQNQIENQLRGLFREELPALLYRVSQQWTPEHKNFQYVRQALQNREGVNVKPVTFAELDQDMQVSLVNRLYIEALTMSRRTLAIKVPQIQNVIFRSELAMRHKEPACMSVGLFYEAIYEHAHSQARRIASKASHKPRRRVFRLNLQNCKGKQADPSYHSPNIEPAVTNSDEGVLHSDVSNVHSESLSLPHTWLMMHKAEAPLTVGSECAAGKSGHPYIWLNDATFQLLYSLDAAHRVMKTTPFAGFFPPWLDRPDNLGILAFVNRTPIGEDSPPAYAA